MYTAKQFQIPELKGISPKTIEEHLGLYQGYVKHVNKIADLLKETSKHNEYALKEARRRLAFEFDGMRNHEYYFALFEGGANSLSESPLKAKIEEDFGSFDNWLEAFKGSLATTRGVGWAILGYDTHAGKLVNYWVDEQHFGHLTGVQPIVTLDMWEHSYVMDYAPSEKKGYIEAFFDNLNWKVAEKFFEDVSA